MTVLVGGNGLINSDMMRFHTGCFPYTSILPALVHLSSEISYTPGNPLVTVVGVGDFALTSGHGVLCLYYGATINLERTMTVGELRKILAPLPADMLAVRGDNSGGYEAIYQPKTVEVTNLFIGTKVEKATAVAIE